MVSKAIRPTQKTMPPSDELAVNKPNLEAEPASAPAANFSGSSHTESFLNGKVKKRTLPQVHGRPGPDAPVLKRLSLPQGDLAQFWDGEHPIRYMAFVELLANTLRGNHFHRRKHEFVYIISGEVEVSVAEQNGNSRQTFRATKGDVISIEPGVAHVYRVIAGGSAIEFAPTSFNSQDTFPQTLLQLT